MCGRYTLSSPADLIAQTFGLDQVPELAPRYNIAPTQPVAAVRLDSAGRRRLDFLRWGLVPGWAQDPSIGNRMINARAETVHVKPAFRTALRHRRCLILSDGFYEWRKTSEGKQPMHICMRDHHPFAFAGLWEHWQTPQGEALESCTIITTAANALLAPIHDRMPVILPPQHHDRWLDPAAPSVDPLRALLVPYAGEDMTAWPVDSRVNNPRNDSPHCMEPLH